MRAMAAGNRGKAEARISGSGEQETRQRLG